MSDDVTQSIQTRCPRMREHYYQANPLPMPCADCYSLRVTSERLPEWQPEVRWRSIPSRDDCLCLFEDGVIVRTDDLCPLHSKRPGVRIIPEPCIKAEEADHAVPPTSPDD